MRKEFLKQINESDTLEKKMFWVVSIVGMGASLIVAILGLFLDWPDSVSIVHFPCAAVFIAIELFAMRSKNYDFYYPLLAFIFAAILVPASNISFHGIFHWQPMFCLLILLTCILCRVMVIRIITSLVAIFTNAISFFVIMKTFPAEEVNIRFEDALGFIIIGLVALVFGSVLMNMFNQYALSKQVLNQYMDYNVQKEFYLGKTTDEVVTTSTIKNATVLFADINNFTSLTEQMDPKYAAEYLNIFLSIADRCIHENGGTLDKYIGDCAMAFWLDEKKEGYGVYEACKTVLDMKKELSSIQESIYERFGCELDFSAGINYGDVMVGGIGSDRRRDYTVIGDTVNTAQRLQTIATRGVVCVSESMAGLLGGSADLELITENVMLKGKTKGALVYELKHLYEKSNPQNLMKTIRKEEQNEANKKWVLHICGCRGSYSVTGNVFTEFGGETSCYIIKHEDYAIVIDCGTGLYKAKNILSDCRNIDVLLTHVHYDHILGLLDCSVFPHDAEIKIYGNFSEWEGKDTIHNFLRAPFWPVDLSSNNLISINKKTKYQLGEEVFATFYEASHPNASCFIILESNGKKISVLADCEDPDILPKDIVKGSNIVIYDGMYEDKYYSKHIGWGHSTWERGVRLALEHNIDKLIITHHNPIYSDRRLRVLELRAQEMFPSTTFARAGDKYSL